MKTYIISKENRIANSPFFIEGSNTSFDITTEFPLPVEATTFNDKGDPIQIRYIMGCDTIMKEEQVKKGFPVTRKPTDMERKLLTFMAGMLSVPDGYKTLEQYLDITPWFKEKKGTRPADARIIYEVYDQDKIDNDLLDEELLITEARQMALKSSREQLISILRLASPGAVIDPNTKMQTLKLRVLDIATTNPDFVIKGIRGARETITVVVSKAIDYNLLNMDTAKKVLMVRRDDPSKWNTIASIPDVGGRQQKTERTVSFFESEDGKPIFNELKKMVAEKDLQLYGNDEDEEEDRDSIRTDGVVKDDVVAFIPNAENKNRSESKPPQQKIPVGPTATGAGTKKNDSPVEKQLKQEERQLTETENQ